MTNIVLHSLDLAPEKERTENEKLYPNDIDKENADANLFATKKRKLLDLKPRPRKRARVEPLSSSSVYDQHTPTTDASMDVPYSPLSMEFEDNTDLVVDLEILPEEQVNHSQEEPVDDIVHFDIDSTVSSESEEPDAVDLSDNQQGIEIFKVNELSRLYLGDADVAEDLAWLKSANIRYILNAALEVPNYHEDEFVYHKESLIDGEDEDIRSKLHSLTNFVNKCLHAGSVLVHCKLGRSRSVAIIYAFLMKYGGKTLLAAKNLIEDELKVATKLNNGFKRQLMEFEKEIRGVSEPSHDFLTLPKRVSTPPARLRNIIDYETKKRRNSAPPTVPVNSSSPRKVPKESMNKVQTQQNELEDLIEKFYSRLSSPSRSANGSADSSYHHTIESDSE